MLTFANQVVEALAMLIEEIGVVFHGDGRFQARLQLTIEVDQVGIDVVEESLSGPKSQGHG